MQYKVIIGQTEHPFLTQRRSQPETIEENNTQNIPHKISNVFDIFSRLSKHSTYPYKNKLLTCPNHFSHTLVE